MIYTIAAIIYFTVLVTTVIHSVVFAKKAKKAVTEKQASPVHVLALLYSSPASPSRFANHQDDPYASGIFTATGLAEIGALKDAIKLADDNIARNPKWVASYTSAAYISLLNGDRSRAGNLLSVAQTLKTEKQPDFKLPQISLENVEHMLNSNLIPKISSKTTVSKMYSELSLLERIHVRSYDLLMGTILFPFIFIIATVLAAVIKSTVLKIL